MKAFNLRRFRQTVLTILVSFVLTQAASYAGTDFHGLGDLSGGAVESYGFGVSGDGSVVVGASLSGSGNEAFRWTRSSGMAGLGDLPGEGFNSRAWGASTDGSVIVGHGNSGAQLEAMRWTQSTGMVGLGDLPGGTLPGGRSVDSAAYRVSGDGSLVVGRGLTDSGYEAFRWTQGGGMVGLGVLPGYLESAALGISGNGSVIVGSSTTVDSNFSQTGEAFRWTATGGMVGIGFLPGREGRSGANGVSSDGAVVVGFSSLPGQDSSFAPEAFRWTAGGGMEEIGFLPGHAYSSAIGTSGDGSVIIGQSWFDGATQHQREAFIWDQASGMRSLRDLLIAQGEDVTGWALSSAYSISNDGTVITGQGLNPSGHLEGWVATVPEPAGLALLACGGMGLLGRRRAVGK